MHPQNMMCDLYVCVCVCVCVCVSASFSLNLMHFKVVVLVTTESGLLSDAVPCKLLL